jgi:hypothetical protein
MEVQLREVNKMAGTKGKADEVFAKVKEIIIREARVDEASVTPDATMNDLYADSATRMSIDKPCASCADIESSSILGSDFPLNHTCT